MMKLITPPGMLLTVALLVIYSVYAFLIASIERSWVLWAACGIAVVASYGTAMLRPWSRYLVYLLATGFTAKLGHSIYDGVVSGYFDFQFGSVRQSLKALLPSAMMALLSFVCCILVYRNFRGASESKDGVATSATCAHRDHGPSQADDSTTPL